MDLVNLIPALFILFSIGIFVLAFGWIIRQSRRAHEKLREMAPRLSLRFTGKAADLEQIPGPAALRPFLQVFFPWRLEGEREGIPVAIFPETRGSGKSKTTYSVVEALLPNPLAFKFTVCREHTLLKWGKKLFKMQDLEVGEPSFDQKVRIQGEDSAAVTALFSEPGLQRLILGYFEQLPDLVLTESHVRWEFQGTLLIEEKYAEVIEAAATLATRLSGAFRA